MKKQIMRFMAALLMLYGAASFGGDFFKNRGGILLRSGYWSMDENDPAILVRNRGIFDSETRVGGFSGAITFLSGIGENGAIAFSLGGVAKVHVIEQGIFDEYVDVKVATPILVGYQYALFRDRNLSAFQPYATFGGGPYVLSHVVNRSESCFDDDATVTNKIRPGIYAGTGAYFTISSWFAVHADMRYHLVNMTPENEYSGFEIGAGLAFFWRR